MTIGGWRFSAGAAGQEQGIGLGLGHGRDGDRALEPGGVVQRVTGASGHGCSTAHGLAVVAEAERQHLAHQALEAEGEALAATGVQALPAAQDIGAGVAHHEIEGRYQLQCRAAGGPQRFGAAGHVHAHRRADGLLRGHDRQLGIQPKRRGLEAAFELAVGMRRQHAGRAGAEGSRRRVQRGVQRRSGTPQLRHRARRRQGPAGVAGTSTEHEARTREVVQDGVERHRLAVHGGLRRQRSGHAAGSQREFGGLCRQRAGSGHHAGEQDLVQLHFTTPFRAGFSRS